MVFSSIFLFRRSIVYPFETPVFFGRRCLGTASSRSRAGAALKLWHEALSSVAPPRHLLLPKGHPDGSQACAIQALLGDSLIKTAVLREMGVKLHPAPELNEGGITERLSQAISNKVFSGAAVDILVTPGVDISAQDIEILPTHGRGTAVESAVAMVYERKGEDPVRELARELINRSKQSRDWKSYLLDMGGTVTSEAVGPTTSQGFVARAELHGYRSKTAAWPSKLSAEQDAAEDVCHQAGLVSSKESSEDNDGDVTWLDVAHYDYNWKGALLEMNGSVTGFPCENASGFYAKAKLKGHISTSECFDSKKVAEQAASRQVLFQSGLGTPPERAALKLEQAKQAMALAARIAEAEVPATWLQAGHNLVFEELGVTEASTKGPKGAEWFVRHASKLNYSFNALMLSPVALPEHVESTYAWGATIGNNREAHVAVALVTLKNEQGRWFVSQTQPTMTKARNNVAARALHDLGLVERAVRMVQ